MKLQKNGVPPLILNKGNRKRDNEWAGENVSPTLSRPVLQVDKMLLDPKTCYSKYVEKSLAMFHSCTSKISYDATLLEEYAKHVDDILRSAIDKVNPGCRIANKCVVINPVKFTEFIRQLASITYKYDRCAMSSILRTGTIRSTLKCIVLSYLGNA